MSKNAISLDSLLETHELPFIIIDASLKVVGLNRAWKHSFGKHDTDGIGKPCCEHTPNCRHHKMFQQLEPYESTELQQPNRQIKVRGYPLLDSDGTVYLGESITQIKTTPINIDETRMIGTSPCFLTFKKQLLRATQSLAPVFLMGETGSGKELAAEFIHNHSKLSDHELVIVDCTVLSEELFESELFGHEKGSFTGASTSKKGLFELADQGTLFLDEIAELPLSQQPKLLRALETGQFRHVGGTTTLKSNVRIVCATHQNLSEMVKLGKFREDLFYRLSVFPIPIPPLRDRLNDIPSLTDTLLKQISLRDDQDYSINKTALIKLLQHQWPGNIRELKNCLQLACNLCVDHQISEQDIIYMEQLNTPKASLPSSSEQNSTATPLAQMESNVIKDLIAKHQGNRKLIAAEMDISERTLYRKLKRFDLN